MADYLLAFDLGTGGNKASLFDADGACFGAVFSPYDTRYPQANWREQRPSDWWDAIVQSTRQLLADSGADPGQIRGIGISGHSLGVVPVDRKGRLLRDAVPIWSDSRPDRDQLDPFFNRVSQREWYMTTGNGFPPPLYSVFKILWFRDREPECFARAHRILGTKDYINLRLTGRMVTDPSYASGCGVYDLARWNYSPELIGASGLPPELFPEIIPSTAVVGELTKGVARELGLSPGVPVVTGGVDNSCMALGAMAYCEGRAYNSLGSSSWIAVSSSKPLLDPVTRPYVFAHVVPGMFVSATAVFAAGSCFRWARDTIARDQVRQAAEENRDPYDLMTEAAATVPGGANGLLFNPSLAGGSSLDASPHIRGAFAGLDLKHTQADVLRAVMEGVALGLRVALDALRKLTPLCGDMIVVGGGSKSTLWRQIYADVYNLRIIKTAVDQQAAALGAAALAAVGTGLWKDFEKLDKINEVESIAEPDAENNKTYERLLPAFAKISSQQAEIAKMFT